MGDEPADRVHGFDPSTGMDWTVEPFVEYSSTNTSCPTPVEMGVSPVPTRTTARFTELNEVCIVDADAVGVDDGVEVREEVDVTAFVEERDDAPEAEEKDVGDPDLVKAGVILEVTELVGVYADELVAEPVSLGRFPYVRVLVPDTEKAADAVGLQDGEPEFVGVKEDDGVPVAEFALLPVEDRVETGV